MVGGLGTVYIDEADGEGPGLDYLRIEARDYYASPAYTTLSNSDIAAHSTYTLVLGYGAYIRMDSNSISSLEVDFAKITSGGTDTNSYGITVRPKILLPNATLSFTSHNGDVDIYGLALISSLVTSLLVEDAISLALVDAKIDMSAGSVVDTFLPSANFSLSENSQLSLPSSVTDLTLWSLVLNAEGTVMHTSTLFLNLTTLVVGPGSTLNCDGEGWEDGDPAAAGQGCSTGTVYPGAGSHGGARLC
jgi:hypothetical protein